MTHKIFKVLNFYYVHIDEQSLLCPLADFIDENSLITEVIEVKYIPKARQGVVVVRFKANDEEPETYLSEMVKNFNEKIQ